MTNSLYFRLNFSAILVLCVFLTATGAVLDNAYSESAKLALRERMMGVIYQLLAASQIDDDGRLIMPLPTHLPAPQLALPHSGWYAFVSRNGDPKPLWRSPSSRRLGLPEPYPILVGHQHWQELKLPNGKPYHLMGFGFQRTVKSGVYPFSFFVLTEMTPFQRDLWAFRQRLWGGLCGAAILLIAVHLWLLHWGFRPLRQVSTELGAIETGAADRIMGNYPNEIKSLTDHINSLLSQERARQTRYRNALADLAHSLKTPLAVLLGATANPAELPDAVQEQSTRMLRIVERQLQRAGASGSMAMPPIAIAAVSERVVASLSKAYAGKSVTVTHHIDPDLHLRCDEADLIELLGNLLDNAFKWCRHRIDIQGHKQGHKIALSIHDDGRGIAPEQIQRILLRGVRADESVPGHGIGLSVVAEIVEAQQGHFSIGASPLGGVMVELEFWEN